MRAAVQHPRALATVERRVFWVTSTVERSCEILSTVPVTQNTLLSTVASALEC
jgi:hypothetical protein